ncbi:MAG: phosphoribosylanthranilate isomerase [Parachlamydiaceae bacterium]|nr:phosphoribosylanthranilate isomerase [Parachlamydiaceae bacterium]
MKVKICGITHPDDAKCAAQEGADYIGIIFSDHSRRKVSIPLAIDIVHATKYEGAEPIGVFVDETADQIISFCENTGINRIQLHGSISKQSLPLLFKKYSIIYAIGVEGNGIATETYFLPEQVIPLYDNSKGGTGISFDWKSFHPPKNMPWILAGGLNPENVTEAINLLKPYGVDVSSGVEYPNMTRKDPILIKAFMQAIKQCEEYI